MFALAAFALEYSKVAGAFEEPLLLLVMGTLFLVAGKLSGARKNVSTAQLEERRV